MSKSRTLASETGMRAGAWREKGDSTMKEGRFQGGEGGQARTASLGEVEGSMSGCIDAKALQEDMQSLGFTPCLTKPEIGNKVGRRRARS